MVYYLRPIEGEMILRVIDAHSKWIEAIPVPSTSSISTITVLRNLFATHGIPELIFSDNSTSFASEEFGTFTRGMELGAKHVLLITQLLMAWLRGLFR